MHNEDQPTQLSENPTDEELINAPAHGIQPGAAGAQADARHGFPTGTTPPPGDTSMLEEEPVQARDLDPDEPVDAVAGDLKPDTKIG